MGDWLAAIILGVVEGLTEFIPVSSTGHLLITKEMLGLTDARWDPFIYMIQLGAILAVVALYFTRLWKVLLGLFGRDASAWRFTIAVLIAFLPSAILGLLAKDVIFAVLFNSLFVFLSLIIGGVILLLVERWAPPAREYEAMALTFRSAALIGLYQCLSIIPGVSRSGATIVGGLLSGVDKRAAAEFSFFLAIPTMVGAFAVSLWETRDVITADFLGLVAIGFVVSFVSGAFVVKTMLDFVARHGFAPFAWWRIVVGALGLVALSLGWIG